MKGMIQVQEGGEWVDLMPVIGARHDKAMLDVMQRTGKRVRIHRLDEDGGDDVA